jgi:NCS1 family nucleobase:cation symporter-1
MFWLGFQSFLGATAINSILVIVTGGGWSGSFNGMLAILVIFIGIQVVTTARGVNAIAWFEKLVSPVMVLMGLYILYWIMSENNITLLDIIQTPAGDVPSGQMQYTFGYAVTSATGYWATMSLNILDFTRYYKAPETTSWYKRNKGLIWSQAIGVVTTMVFFAFIGAAAMVATGLWNPVDVITSMNAPTALTIIALIVAALAQWSTNIGANILPPANIFVNAFAPKVNFAGGCIIAGIIAFAMQTWKYGNFLITIFAYISGALGAIAGTMIVDYYILRGRKLNVVDLYKFDGQYRYCKNYNPAAFIAYLVGFGTALLWLDWAFLVSGILGGVVYFLLMRYWGAKKYGQLEIMERFNIK